MTDGIPKPVVSYTFSVRNRSSDDAVGRLVVLNRRAALFFPTGYQYYVQPPPPTLQKTVVRPFFSDTFSDRARNVVGFTDFGWRDRLDDGRYTFCAAADDNRTNRQTVSPLPPVVCVTHAVWNAAVWPCRFRGRFRLSDNNNFGVSTTAINNSVYK